MRKLLFLPALIALCMADFGAFAAGPTRGNGRGAVASNNAQNASVNTSASANKTSTGNVAARAAKKTVANKTSGTGAAKQNVSVSGVATGGRPTMAARAGSTQKVINNGTKIAAASTITTVSQECQDAFYGCMDSFCMIENASGGRCQCSNKNDDLLSIMDDIAKLDEQSYAMATEGVERIKLGENADAIIASATSAGNKAANKESAEPKERKLDLSSWNNNIFSEDDELDIFSQNDSSSVSNVLNKKGDALYDNSLKLCVAQMPAQCKDSLNMLQSIYVQKIKSDCTAFENSLKQQKSASAQKLQAAEKALRDAALEKFQDDNKWNRGQCITQYSLCMEKECGADYTNCITFAAEENVKAANSSARSTKKSNARNRTIKGVVDIVLSGATMTQLNAKKAICDDEVLSHCVNVRDTVWDGYLANAATTIKSAEYIAEDNLRSNCLKETATCFQSACAAQFDPNQEEASYDMCLSDPMLVVDFCKVKLESCVIMTGATNLSEQNIKNSSFWRGIVSFLSAMKVDACTKEVKAGIEALCGTDFSYCVGLNPGTIAELLPTDTLTACKDKNKNDENAILNYISDVAQGYALQINDTLFAQCQNAAKAAMVKICGDADTCDSLDLGNMSFDSILKVQICEDGTDNCSVSANDFDAKDIVLGRVNPRVQNRINTNAITYKIGTRSTRNARKANVLQKNSAQETDIINEKSISEGGTVIFEYDVSKVPQNQGYATDAETVSFIVNGLENLVNNKIKVLKSDKIVGDCMNGKNVTGFKKDGERTRINNAGKDSQSNATLDAQDAIFQNLLDSHVDVLINRSLALMREKYDEAEKNLQPEIDSMNSKISERLDSIKEASSEKIHATNRLKCEIKALNRNADNNTTGTEKKNKKPYYKINSNGTEIVQTNDDADEDCGRKNGFCRLGEKHFFDTGEGRNRRREALYWVTWDYDESTSKCTLTKTEYKCTNYLSPYCWSWDTTGKQVDQSTEQMPKIKTEDMINTAKGVNTDEEKTPTKLEKLVDKVKDAVESVKQK